MAGRKTKLTPKIRRIIVESVRNGNFYTNAAKIAGVAPETVSRWLAKGAEGVEPYRQFRQELKKAEAESIDESVRIIREASKKDWKAAAWYLERKAQRDWGKNKPLDIDLNRLSDEQLSKIAAGETPTFEEFLFFD